MRIAIMQPYFLPYAGYFRLFQETDLFVIYDCVQFIRRGWIHRNRLTHLDGQLSWLTLPLLKAPQDTRISEMRFLHDSTQRMLEQQNKFSIFKSPEYCATEFQDALMNFTLHPVAYISHLLKLSCEKLNIPFRVAYSSQLQLPIELKGQERIIAIAKHYAADVYINPPGGRDLYNEHDFRQQTIKLKFLPDYCGSYESILPRLINEDIDTLRNEILKQGISS